MALQVTKSGMCGCGYMKLVRSDSCWAYLSQRDPRTIRPNPQPSKYYRTEDSAAPEKKKKKPVQSFADNVDYIPDFLYDESTARAVIATRCQFGWPKVSIPATCLYVDADNLANLELLPSNETTPAVILRAKLKHSVDNATRATDVVTQGLDVVESSKRKVWLKMNKSLIRFWSASDCFTDNQTLR